MANHEWPRGNHVVAATWVNVSLAARRWTWVKVEAKLSSTNKDVFPIYVERNEGEKKKKRKKSALFPPLRKTSAETELKFQ